MKLLSIMLLSFLSTLTFTQTETTNTLSTTNNNTNTLSTTNNSTNMIDENQKLLESWTETMQFGISDQRLAVVKKIRFSTNDTGITLLESSFSNESNPIIKEEIIYTFLDKKKKDNIQFWTDLFANEKNLTVLQRAAYAAELLEIPIGSSIFTSLTNNIEDPNAMRFNASAIQALGTLKTAEALPIIVDTATNTTNHQDLRGAAVVALGKYQDESQIPILQQFLTNQLESRLIRRYAALGIGHTKSPQAIDILAPVATNEQEEQTVRLNSIAGLGYAQIESIIPVLEQLTKSDNTAVRTEAIKSLGKMKAESAKKILQYKAKSDPEAIVRREAKNALKAIDESTEDTTTTN